MNSRPSVSFTPVARPPTTLIFATSTPVINVPPLSVKIEVSASTNLIPPPTGTGIPPSATAAPITLVINALLASSGPSPLCSAHGARSALLTGEVNVRSSHGDAGSRSSAPTATKPRLPKRERAVRKSLSAFARHKSAPSNPKAKSIFPKNSLSMVVQASPSPRRPNSAAVAARSVERIALPPSQTTPVGLSVLRYTSPRASKSAFNSPYAGPPTKSGCQLDRSSWVNPGSVAVVTVLIAPPASLFRSRTRTFWPDLLSRAAATNELIPLPIMMTSLRSTNFLHA